MTWLLTIGWVATILILVNDIVDWSLAAQDLNTRQLRLMAALVPMAALTMFAVWTVVLPYIPLTALKGE